MLDLMKLHEALVHQVSDNTITEDEASVLYDTMFNEQVVDLILDIYDAFTEGTISSDEANGYIAIAMEAVKGDKLSNKAENKIDDELKDLPDKERKAVEDSIKKASKESTKKGTAFKVNALNSVDKVLKSKKTVKESVDVTETAASDSREKLHDAQKKYRECMKRCNKLIIDKEYGKAKNELVEARTLCEKMSYEVEQLDSNVGGVLISGFCEGLITSVKATAVGIGVGVVTRDDAIASGAASGIVIVDIVKALYGIIKSVKNKGSLSVSDFNATKAKVIGTIDALVKLIDKKEKAIDNLEKKAKEVKEAEEATLDLDAELSLFEEKMSDEEKEHLADLAVTGTIVTAITLPFALTFISIAKGFKKVKEGNKYFKEIQAVDNQILGVNAKYNDKFNKLKREWEDMYEYSSLFKKYYIPKKNKEKMKELKERFRKLEDDYNAEVRPLVIKRKELEKKYTAALTGKN